MNIFIDESGNFLIPSEGKKNLSCAGALVVPELKQRALLKGYNQLKKKWPYGKGEIKGSQLNEEEVAAVIDLLIKHRCVFVVCATEMSLYTQDELDAYQQLQIDSFTRNSTDEHTEGLWNTMRKLQEDYRKMSSQLFVQSNILSGVLRKIIREVPTYFAFNAPTENSRIQWVIDAKNKEKKTRYEAAWEVIVGGVLQTQFLHEPPIGVKGGNYTYYDSAFMMEGADWPDYMPCPNIRGQRGGLMDLNAVLESMRFESSEKSLGLQLVDIVTNAFRRAVMGRLQLPGYKRMGELMIKVDEGALGLYQLAEERDAPIEQIGYHLPLEVIEQAAVDACKKRG